MRGPHPSEAAQLPPVPLDRGGEDGVVDDVNHQQHLSCQFGTLVDSSAAAPRSTDSASLTSALNSTNTSTLGSSPLTLQDEINKIMASAVDTHFLSALRPDGAAGKGDAEVNFNFKGFNEDPLVMPCDLSAPALTSLDFDLSNPIIFPLTSIAPSIPFSAHRPFSLPRDSELESPLGFEQDSPFSELLASPAFAMLPTPAMSSSSGGGEQDFHALFPPSPFVHLPPFAPLPPLPSASGDLSPFLCASASSTSTPALSPVEPSPPSTSTVTTGDQTTLDITSATRPRATGFRGTATALLPLDAPIRPREYKIPSATAKKRKTSAIEKGLAKRGRTSSSPEITTVNACAALEEEIPTDLLEAAEKKRLQNTLSARKSRLRKQNKLAELEGRNEELERVNTELRERVERLEAAMRSAGVVV